MKKVIYITNKEVPYKVVFFNELSKYCDLEVIYENMKQKNRDNKWSKSVKNNFNYSYLYSGFRKKWFSFKLTKYLLQQKNNIIIFGCINSKLEITTILLMRLFRRKYMINLDGEYFDSTNNFKNKVKKFILKGAKCYFVAGVKASMNLKKVIKNSLIVPYYFSSLTDLELKQNKKLKNNNKNDYILVVGQYFDYKGLDIALQVAQKNEDLKYKFVGMGNRTDLFLEKVNDMKLSNVEVISFLPKAELYDEYRNCKLLLLPSRKECWGLVINEAASFGTPIISTDGSGAAVEFLTEKYPQFIAESGNVDDIYNKIINLINFTNIEEYKTYLIDKSKDYSIERCVQSHINIINKVEK